jgi:hypothetical protein
MKLTIEIPMTPSKKLSPNHGLDKRWKSDETKSARYAALQCARAALGGQSTPVFAHHVWVVETVYWGKGERKVDLDAVPVMCKPYLDGICDAQIIVNDSQVARLIVEQYRAPDGIGKTTIEVFDWEEWAEWAA